MTGSSQLSPPGAGWAGHSLSPPPAAPRPAPLPDTQRLLCQPGLWTETVRSSSSSQDSSRDKTKVNLRSSSRPEW